MFCHGCLCEEGKVSVGLLNAGIVLHGCGKNGLMQPSINTPIKRPKNSVNDQLLQHVHFQIDRNDICCTWKSH